MTAGIRTESDLSTAEKEMLINGLRSKGYKQTEDTQYPRKLEFSVSSYSSDPLSPSDPQSWVVKFDPVHRR
ncbi:hypothetical protein BGP75_04150 [Motiliproteus sp. MSK22-1]|nr:hypothetical protein BGP75_04150 [Motiliproteus sp. MSK22-1]